MDEGGISVQVLSHALADASPENCIHASKELAGHVSSNPRYATFAMLPISHPEAAAKELERCVKELGFVGALIDNHTADGTFFDDSKLWPMFESAERYGVPMHFHPTFQAESREAYYEGNYDEGCKSAIGHCGWAWHANTAEHLLHLFAAGPFDKYLNLVVLGHRGEMLPFQLERIDAFPKNWGKHKRGLKKGLGQQCLDYHEWHVQH